MECTQKHLQRSGRTEGEEGCLCDVTAESAERSVSRDSADAVDMATSPHKRPSQTLGSTSQWGAHVLDAVTITTDNHSSVVLPVTGIAPASHSTPPLMPSSAFSYRARLRAACYGEPCCEVRLVFSVHSSSSAVALRRS